MDFSKLGPQLISALREVRRSGPAGAVLPVLMTVDDATSIDTFKKLGLNPPPPDSTLVTAEVTELELQSIVSQPWLQQVELAAETWLLRQSKSMSSRP